MSDIDVRERTRLRRVTEVRQVTFYLLKRKTRMSYQKIGNLFGLTHATVLHGVKLIKVLSENDRNFKKKYGIIINTINHIYFDK
jgi:chromosomal replication initiation ATPase DnaA